MPIETEHFLYKVFLVWLTFTNRQERNFVTVESLAVTDPTLRLPAELGDAQPAPQERVQTQGKVQGSFLQVIHHQGAHRST